MALTQLTKKCRICPFVNSCDHKQMEAHGALQVYLTQFYKDELKNELYKSLYSRPELHDLGG